MNLGTDSDCLQGRNPCFFFPPSTWNQSSYLFLQDGSDDSLSVCFDSGEELILSMHKLWYMVHMANIPPSGCNVTAPPREYNLHVSNIPSHVCTETIYSRHFLRFLTPRRILALCQVAQPAEVCSLPSSHEKLQY